MNTGVLITTGKVEYVEGNSPIGINGEADAWRVKVRLDSDGNSETTELPWAFPAMPKVIQAVPKVGEGVFVITANIGKPNSQRYYLGPIISQPQFQEYCDYGTGGRGPAMSLFSTAKPLTEKPLTSISRMKDLTYGAFPKLEDVALVGRGQEDVVLKYRNASSGSESEVDLRAGIRLEPTDTTIKYMKGNVVFNDQNPAYIQVKYAKNGLAGINEGEGDNDPDKYEAPSVRTANGVVNLVADKFNLISHQDSNRFGTTICDKDNLIKDGELDQIMSVLHRAVYGDELIVLLKKIVSALATHTHPYPMLPPTIEGTELADIVDYDYEKVISPHVRLS